MTPQEIKDGMTNGEWVETHLHHIQADNDKGDFIADCGFESLKHATPNVAAIVSAVNNTYGNNINPDVVPEMVKVLEFLLKSERFTTDWPNVSKDIHNILNRAKLTP
jgi:hypothetical protein